MFKFYGIIIFFFEITFFRDKKYLDYFIVISGIFFGLDFSKVWEEGQIDFKPKLTNENIKMKYIDRIYINVNIDRIYIYVNIDRILYVNISFIWQCQ